MANAEPRTSVVTETVGQALVAVPPLAAYRGALARLDLARLRAITVALGFNDPEARSANLLAGQIADSILDRNVPKYKVERIGKTVDGEE